MDIAKINIVYASNKSAHDVFRSQHLHPAFSLLFNQMMRKQTITANQIRWIGWKRFSAFTLPRFIQYEKLSYPRFQRIKVMFNTIRFVIRQWNASSFSSLCVFLRVVCLFLKFQPFQFTSWMISVLIQQSICHWTSASHLWFHWVLVWEGKVNIQIVHGGDDAGVCLLNLSN